MTVIHFGNYSRIAFAPVGASIAEVVETWHDTHRYAVEIQSARDSKDFSKADAKRSLVTSLGGSVFTTKKGTFVVEGPKYEIANQVPFPEFLGSTEWVEPEKVNGRKVIDTSYVHYTPTPIHPILSKMWWSTPSALKRLLPGSLQVKISQFVWRESEEEQPVVSAHNVMLWNDHPNLSLAKSIGLPMSLWTAEGQNTIYNSTSGWWVEKQVQAVDKARVDIAIKKAMEEILKERKLL